MTVRSSGDQFSKRSKSFIPVVKSLIHLVKSGQLAWLLYVVEHRLEYPLNALHSGVLMNRRGEANIYNFRRNIHRLEKGLSYQPPRDTFAENFILETIKYLSQIKKLNDCDLNTIAWGEAVLEQYFKTCQHSEPIAEAYRLYQRIEPEISQPTWYPYPEKQRPEIAVEYEALYQLACRRRSVRYYLDKTVEFDVVEGAMRVAALSPSACNRQAFRFLFYNDQKVVKKIAEIPGGVEGYELPSIIVVTGSYRAYFDERDTSVPIIDASLAVMAFLFALETLGLSSVCINWPSLPDRDRLIRTLIRLEEDEFIVMLIGIGYPDPQGKIPYSAKKTTHELIFCNERINPTTNDRSK